MMISLGRGITGISNSPSNLAPLTSSDEHPSSSVALRRLCLRLLEAVVLFVATANNENCLFIVLSFIAFTCKRFSERARVKKLTSIVTLYLAWRWEIRRF